MENGGNRLGGVRVCESVCVYERACVCGGKEVVIWKTGRRKGLEGRLSDFRGLSLRKGWQLLSCLYPLRRK